MQRAHKIALDPTNRQATGLAKAAGCARFAYNWALVRWQQEYAYSTYEMPDAVTPSQLSLRRELNAVKRERFPWMLESSKCAPQEAIIQLGRAFQNFFAGRAKYPRFKKRGVHDSFRLSVGQFRVEGKRLRVPNIGWIRLREAVRFEGVKLVSVTISRTAGRWFAAVQCDIPAPAPKPVPASRVGVDVGVRAIVVSDGDRHPVPRNLRGSLRRLKRAQQALSRKERGSANRVKARAKVATLHARVADARAEWLHRLTTGLANAHDVIVIEDLHVRGMMRNRRLALSITDAGFGEFRRQLTYKTLERGTSLVVADRWFPSSKLCRECGAKAKRLALVQREWDCSVCGARHDRDLNAARNLAAYDPARPGGPRRGEAGPAASSAVAVCGALLTAAPDGISVSSGVRPRWEAGIRRHGQPELI